jgi:hypothetical protein
MKPFLIIISIILILLVLLQSFTIMQVNKTEEQAYKVILTEGDLEIRFYPSVTIATVQSKAKTYKDLSGPGFRKLAGYIFGGNEGSKKIAMTSPVHMNISDSNSSMSFVMPSAYNESSLPKPNDSSVLITKTKEEYVAAIRFGGFASDEDFASYTKKLESILAKKGIATLGNYRILGYNPPYQLIGRRNEVIVSVLWTEK